MRDTEPTLKNYIARYKLNTELLMEHSEQKELLQKQIDRAEKAIIEIVTSDKFYCKLDYINL